MSGLNRHQRITLIVIAAEPEFMADARGTQTLYCCGVTKTHVHFRFGVSHWRGCRTSLHHRARRSELGSTAWLAASGKHLAGLSGFCGNTIRGECAGDWRVNQRQAAEDSQPESASVIYRPASNRGVG